MGELNFFNNPEISEDFSNNENPFLFNFNNPTIQKQ